MMKRQIAARMQTIGMIAVLGMGLLSGCGEGKKVDYIIEGMEKEEQPQGDGGKSGLTQFEGEENWKDTWTVQIGEREWRGETFDAVAYMSVDAKIIVPGIKQMSVVEVREPEFDAEYKETIAERILEEVYYGDISHLPKKDLEEMQAFFDNGGEVHFGHAVDGEIEKEWQDLWDALDNIENARDTYTPVEEYTVNKYIGIYEGRMYDLSFAEEPGDKNFIRRLKQITMSAKDLYEVCPEKFKQQKDLVCSPWVFGNWVENHCRIPEEEARKEAELFAEKLGLDYSVASSTLPLVWGNPPEVISLTGADESETWEVNGYVFSFDLGVDDISFVDFGMEEDYADFWAKTERDEEIQYSLQARLQVYVTDQGVIQAEANNPVEITGISEDVELLPLDTVKGIMKKEVEEQSETFRLNTYTTECFDEMELIYFRVRDKENPGKFNYVPTWRLASVMKDAQQNLLSIRNPILINAIDGSIINFYDET